MNLTAQLSSVDLTTLARVHELMPSSSSNTSQDTFISQTITDVSARITRYIGLHTLTATRTDEVYELPKFRKILRLDAKALSAVTEVKTSSTNLTTAEWTALTAVDATYYSANLAGGWIRFYSAQKDDPNFIAVTYTGGFGATAAAVITAFPELSQACDIQVKYLVERRSAIAGNITTIAGASTSYNSAYGLHREVREIINMHRKGRV